jgi:hypothetical protein
LSEPRKITGFRAGDPLRIQRRVGRTRADLAKESLVFLRILKGNQVVLTKQTQFTEDKPEYKALPGSNIVNPQIKSFFFDLTPRETSLLEKDQAYSYHISSGSGTPLVQSLESGLLQVGNLSSPPTPPGSPPPPPPPIPPLVLPGSPGYSSETAYTSYANACETVTGRTALVIDGFVDAIIGAYRQLKVWDEHARRRADNPTRLQLTYEYINKFTPIEIYDSNNNPVTTSVTHPFDPIVYPGPTTSVPGRLLLKDPSLLLSPPISPPVSPPVSPPSPSLPVMALADFDYRNGNFSINGDDGNQDFFVTYTFDFFPENMLVMFVNQTVYELNFIGAGPGTYVTNYTSIESIPETWLGLVALGVAAKAWKRLATDIPIWRNFLIFDGDTGDGIQAPTGAMAQQTADSASQYYQQMYETFASGTKYEKFLAQPTTYYQIFASSGYGSFGPMVNGNRVVDGNFRGLVINKGTSY